MGKKTAPSVIFAADGAGMGMNSVMVSAHKDYASFSRLLTKLRQDWQPSLKDMQSFMICVNRPELFINNSLFSIWRQMNDLPALKSLTK